jgi:hypothetical protein
LADANAVAGLQDHVRESPCVRISAVMQSMRKSGND